MANPCFLELPEEPIIILFFLLAPDKPDQSTGFFTVEFTVDVVFPPGSQNCAEDPARHVAVSTIPEKRTTTGNGQLLEKVLCLGLHSQGRTLGRLVDGRHFSFEQPSQALAHLILHREGRGVADDDNRFCGSLPPFKLVAGGF